MIGFFFELYPLFSGICLELFLGILCTLMIILFEAPIEKKNLNIAATLRSQRELVDKDIEGLVGQ